jgi:hypothetical protein
MYDYSGSDAPARLLFGGSTLAYASPPPGDETIVVSPTTCSLEEIRDISTSVPSMLIVAGGHRSDDRPITTYSTLQYSVDYGATWSTTNNDFSWYATNVVWGGHTNTIEGTTRSWIALGYNITGIPGIKCSTNGTTWIDVDIEVSMTSATLLGPLQFDGTNWNLFVNSLLYTHDANSSTLASGIFWSRPRAVSRVQPDSRVFICSTPWIDGLITPTATLQMGVTSNGPVFTSPSVTSYLGYQYIPITPIIFDTESGDSSFFLASTLPAGFTWSPAVLNENGHVCATITAQPVILGTTNITVYGQNSAGVSKITLTVITQPIPLKTPDTTPSGYTSFLKQKVIADSAVSSINNKALVSPVGTFLANDPKPVTLAPEICCLDQSTQ